MGTQNRKLFPPLPRAAPLFAAVAAAVAITATSAAQTIDGLEAKIAVAREEAQELGAEIEAASAELAAVQERAIAAAQREAELSRRLARGEARERRLEATIAAAEAALEAARARLRRALTALSDRLVAIYKSGVPDATTVLLQADGFDDLATRAEYLRRIEEADANLVSRVRAVRAEVAARLADAEAAEGRAAAHNDRLAAAREEIASVRFAAEAEAAALADARARRETAIEALRGKVDDWTAEVQRLERISEAAAREEVANWFGDWAIPAAIVMCESGGNFTAVNPTSGAGGAYQILPSTWRLYGGEGLPQDAPPAEQHRIAALIWADSGAGAWECA
jgi:septal ring factor EnvC (AmiA/AmiB activator)